MASLPSLDELLKGVPAEKLDAPCKDVHLCQIALSITDWEVIASFLDISTAEAHAIKCDEGKTVQQNIAMLKKWKEKCGRRATYRRLAKRFLMVKRVDLVDRICEVLVDSDSSSDDDSLTSDREVIVYQTLLDQYADHLRHKYPKEIPSFAQWPPPPTHRFFNLAMIQRSRVQLGPVNERYIRLTQRGSVDDIMSNKIAIQVKDIFHLYQEYSEQVVYHGSSKRVIVLIEGAPGAGKSTLAWYICEQWGSRKLFGEFKLVVFVQLRSPAVQSATSIADLLPRMASGQEREVLSHLETRRGRDVLFVLDGWDEYSGGLTCNSICGNLIRSPADLCMQESTLLVTSRPIASGQLQRYCTTRIEIVGFAPQEVKEYFKDSLRVAHQGEQQVEVLQECLKVRPVIQASCYLPLNAAIVVHLFITEGNTLPTTLHGLFTSLVLNCIVRHLTKQEEGKRVPKITSFDTIPTELQLHFNAICGLACHGIMTNKASFSEEELHFFHLSTESSAPLLSLIQGWSTFKSSWEDFSYSFFHLSVQELLAAFHISKQPHTQQVKVFRQLFGQPRFAAVLNFYAAFTKFRVQEIREFIKEVLQSSSRSAAAGVGVRHLDSSSIVQLPRKELHRTILDCLFEAQDPALCQYVATVMEGRLLVDYTMSPFHCMVLGYFLYCLCLTPGGGRLHIDIANRSLDKHVCRYLVSELKKCSHGQLSLSLFEHEQSRGVSVLIGMLRESCSHCISDLSLMLQTNVRTIKKSLLSHYSGGVPVVSLTVIALGSSSDLHLEEPYFGVSYDSESELSVFDDACTALNPPLPTSGRYSLFAARHKNSSSSGSRAISISRSRRRVPVSQLSQNTSRVQVRSGINRHPVQQATITDSNSRQPSLTQTPRSKLIDTRDIHNLKLVAEFLGGNGQSTLKVLKLSGYYISRPIAQALAICLTLRSVLDTLDMSGCFVSLEGAKILCNSLDNFSEYMYMPPKNAGILTTEMPCIKKLNLSQCRMSYEAATMLAGYLATNSNLEVLISGCTPPESAGTLAVALAVRSPQESWDLSGHTIPTAGMKMLADSLPGNLFLKTLNFARCRISLSGVKILARSWSRIQHLKTLDLSLCTVSPEGAAVLASLLVKTSKLEVLISGSRPPESAGILAVALAVCRVWSTQESMDLSGHTIPSAGMKMLADYLARNPSVKVLNLSQCSLLPQSLMMIAGFLSGNAYLKTLNLSCCNTTPEDATVLAGAIAADSNLEVLISGCTPPESAGVLAVALAVRSNQQSWDLSGHTIPPKGMKMLAGSLEDNPTLEALNFSSCSLSPKSALTLARSLARNTNLEVLISGCMPPKSAGILAVALAVRSNQQSWDLSGHTIPPKGMKMLTDSLADNPTLEALNFSSCSILPKGALTLAHSLAKNTNLEVLISGCRPPESAGILTVALAVRSPQQSWDLSGHSIPPEGMKMVTDSLVDNPTLKVLNLSSCSIPMEGALKLAHSLAKNSSLEVFISGCRPPESAGVLAVALAVRSTQESWDLSGHTIPPEGMKMFAGSLAMHPHVHSLNFSQCTIPPEGVGVLCDLLAEHTSLDTVLFSGCSPPVSNTVIDLALAVRSGTNTCDLSECTISAKIITALGYLLDSKLTIDTLNLYGCTISQLGVRLLVKVLLRTQNIKELNFSQCKLLHDISYSRHRKLPTELSAADHLMVSFTELQDDTSYTHPDERYHISHLGRYEMHTELQAVDHLKVSFTHMHMALKVLDLSRNRLGSKGAKALNSFLDFNQFLEVLILSHIDLSTAMRSYNDLHPYGCETAAHPYGYETAAVPYNHATGAHFCRYERAGLHFSVDETGADYLVQGLRQNKSLRSLSITHCNLTYPLMNMIVEAVKLHPSLQKLDFSGNRLTQGEYQALNDQLKRIWSMPKV